MTDTVRQRQTFVRDTTPTWSQRSEAARQQIEYNTERATPAVTSAVEPPAAAPDEPVQTEAEVVIEMDRLMRSMPPGGAGRRTNQPPAAR